MTNDFIYRGRKNTYSIGTWVDQAHTNANDRMTK